MNYNRDNRSLGNKISRESVSIQLPIILVYADDTIVVTEDENFLRCFLDEKNIVLPCTGLINNYNNTVILIRDPLQLEVNYEEGEDYHHIET